MLSLTTRLENGHRGEDRIARCSTPLGALIVVADGAGGVGGAATAAQSVCDVVIARAHEACGDARLWVLALRDADAVLRRAGHGGLTTAVVVEVHGRSVVGASVGDSGALLVGASSIVDFTEMQQRKPLVGSGASRPAAFGPTPLGGRLLVATDGLLKYASLEVIAAHCRSATLEAAADAILQSVRLASGKYHDDVALALGEHVG